MIKRELGNTGLQVSVLGFGSMEIGRLRYEEAEKLLNEALDGGINFVDSSPCYGIAEEYVGKAIGRRRDEYILATKCGCNVGSHGKFSLGPDHIWTADQLYKNIDRSLELLQTEYIDIWQLHGIMPDYLSGGAQDEVIAAAESIKKSGKVRHIAFSCRNGSPDQPMYPALFGFSPKLHFTAAFLSSTISSATFPLSLTTLQMPPTTLSLPGQTQADVTPALTAVSTARSKGLMPSIVSRYGITASL